MLPATEENHLTLPFSVRVDVVIPDDFEKHLRGPWQPMFVIGTRLEAVNFDLCGNEIRDDQAFRIGFCNYLRQPLVQMRTSAGVFETSPGEAINQTDFSFVIVCDSAAGYLELYNWDKLLSRSPIGGDLLLPINSSQTISYGVGKGLGVLYVKVYRGEPDWSLLSGEPEPPELESGGWVNQSDAISRIDSEISGETAFSHYSKFLVEDLDRNIQIIDNFLTFSGEHRGRFDNAESAGKAISKKLSFYVDELEELLRARDVDEPQILKYFKMNPTAAFLLEPDAEMQWREEMVQQYGQIDFVFRLFNGSHLALEIESPKRQIFNLRNEFTHAFHHAVDQAEQWVSGIGKNYSLLTSKFGSSPPEMFFSGVVIGRSDELTNNFRKERWGRKGREIRLLTWDDVISRGRLLIKRLLDPLLNESKWI